MRRFYFALLALVLVLAAQPLVAATYYVGTCKAGAHFTTISDAVAVVPVGSVINVCPGTYPEQIVISHALTLQGMLNSNSSQAVITVPSGGIGTRSSIIPFLGTIAPQVEVTAGPVNITNITVDGTAGTTNCPGQIPYVGIYYASGSSGTVNEVETRNQNCNGVGVGIAAENGAAASPLSVTIENSNIHDNTYSGIITCSDQTPSTLTASIKSNYITGSSYGVITYCNAGGGVSSNFITSGGFDVYAGSPSTTVSGNTVMGGSYGIDVEAAAVVSGNTVSNATSSGIDVTATGSVISNRIVNSPTGITLFVSGATIKSNTITKSNIGIEFSCLTGTITGNTINGAATGIDTVPAAFTGINRFFNVLTVRTNGGC